MQRQTYLHWIVADGTIGSDINNIMNSTMDNNVTAQELKTKGASALTKKTKENSETFITIRGEKRFVVLTIEQYTYLRECELETALKESEADLAAGRFDVKSLEDHLKDLKNV